MKVIQLESGNTITIGQNAVENFKVIDNASPDDLWFHLKTLASCHVVLKSDGPILDQDVKMAAELCLSNTKYREMNSVYVEYIKIKYVEKTETPGKVILRNKPTLLKVINGRCE